MCGICGVLNLDPGLPPVDAGLLDRMTDALTHRGPDDRGTWRDPHVGLGHRRLSVIDLTSRGRQPMSNEDGSVRIVFNGEIYNFQELKQQHALEQRGHTFQSRTDTEVLVHLYEELGPAMVDHLNGMFAYAIWDARSRQLHLARDAFGVKPLFYCRHDGRLLFASEIKGILQDSTIPREVNFQALHDFLTFDYIPGANTAFAGIDELPPGHTLSIGLDDSPGLENTGRLQRFAEPADREDDSLDETTVVREARRLMRQAVERQRVADLPVGVFLSGGLDSSTIVAWMQQLARTPLHTFSVGFEDPSFNELPAARTVARHFGTVHHEVIVTAEMVREALPKAVEFIDEPYADGSAIPTYVVAELARQHVGVVMSGEGGDEVFAGYETHAAYKVARLARHIPRWFRNGLLAPLVRRLPVSDKKLSFEFKLKRFLGGLDLSPQAAHLWWRIVMTETAKQELYDPDVWRHRTCRSPQRHFDEVLRRTPAQDELNRLLHIDAAVFLPDDLMVKNDRMSMAHSLEARVPFTDPDLTRMMARVPARLKLPRLRKKHIMRRAMSGLLPRQILNKRKVGLEMPYARWLKEDLYDILADYGAPERLKRIGLFRPQAVQAMIKEHRDNIHDHGRALWGLLSFLMWHERYIER